MSSILWFNLVMFISPYSNLASQQPGQRRQPGIPDRWHQRRHHPHRWRAHREGAPPLSPPLPTMARGRLRPHLRPRPTPGCTVDTTAMDSATVATMAMASATAMVTTERGVLMLRLRLIPTSCTVATTAMDLDMATAMATLMEPDTPTTDKVLVSPCLGFVSINPF